ncbi:MAG: hypothetical protein MJ061_06880, partial [Mailhella sp.]|nr:hypothetical protein [Mailhella sp.]
QKERITGGEPTEEALPSPDAEEKASSPAVPTLTAEEFFGMQAGGAVPPQAPADAPARTPAASRKPRVQLVILAKTHPESPDIADDETMLLVAELPASLTKETFTDYMAVRRSWLLTRNPGEPWRVEPRSGIFPVSFFIQSMADEVFHSCPNSIRKLLK